MSTMVPMYGFGGGGNGAALTVTAPAGCTVTVSKDGKTKPKAAGTDGVAVFKGLATGTWTLTITDGSQTNTMPVTITADYSAVIAFFSATIHVTYPAGSTCTATDGVTTLTAPDTSGTWDCVVPNAGTWTVACTNGTKTTSKAISITVNGQSKSIALYYNLYLFNNGNFSSEGGNLVGVKLYTQETGQYAKFPNISNSAGILTASINGDFGAEGAVLTKNAIDLTAYNRLKVTSTYYKHNENRNYEIVVVKPLGSLSSTYPHSSYCIAKKEASSAGTVTLDVTGLTGRYHVGVWLKSWNAYVEIKLSKVMLEV